MASAAAVANEFLALGRAEQGLPPMTQMKLQKLLFYVYAWYLAFTGKELFEEDFEAWPWGPVVRDVYTQTAKFGRQPVQGNLIKLGSKPGGGFAFVTPRVDDPEQRSFIENVWSSHKQFSAVQLSNSTHAPGEPWTIVKEQYGSLDDKPTIPNEIIASVFKAKLTKANAGA